MAELQPETSNIWGVWLDNGLAPLFMKIRDDLIFVLRRVIVDTNAADSLHQEAPNPWHSSALAAPTATARAQPAPKD